MSAPVAKAISAYCAGTRRLAAEPSTTETTYYPDVRALLNAVLKAERLPFEARTGTSEARAGGRNMPDFVLGDGEVVGVYGEVKRPDARLADIALSTEQNDQIGRYLARTGVVIVCNVRGFGLVVVDPKHARDIDAPVPPGSRLLTSEVDLWSATTGGTLANADQATAARLVDLLTAAVTDHAPIASPADLAKVLARQARDAKDGIPADLKPLKPLLDDYRQALGLSFDIEDEKGDRFFRSSLVQAVFYSLFAAWVLWDRKAKDDEVFDVEVAGAHLPIPFLAALLHDIRHPTRMRHLGLERHLQRAIATLNRVDRPLFRSRMSFPTLDDDDTTAAITYFYEPFLEAFDPVLREELGVWYTPPEIVRYQVGRVHHLLKSELGIARGLADRGVVVLDPCCGTGAYLLETARCIADELRSEGDENAVGLELSRAFAERVIGFEILTAPFAIAQLQLHLLLDRLGSTPDSGRRFSIHLTNALSGWREAGDVKLNFPEMRDEFDASQRVKRDARIIVVVGNPPYDRFAGAAQAEEAELVATYKGVELVPDLDRKGNPRLDAFGRPKMRQRGDSLLYREYGVRKQLLDDLYIRFLRMAEERIGDAADHGVVCYISNSSFLTGRSHPIVRESLLGHFDEVWIDNLNGDKYRTGKLIPRGLPGAGTRDDSAFSTAADSRGIQPGTAITTWVKRRGERTGASKTAVHYRDLWGPASGKRESLLASLPEPDPESQPNLAYARLAPARSNRWRLSPTMVEGGFEAWPALDELFPTFFQGVNHNRGVEGTVIDADADRLARRMKAYVEAPDFASAADEVPDLAPPTVDGRLAIAGYEPEVVWQDLHSLGFDEHRVRPFLAFPMDERSIYYETRTKLLNRPRPEYEANMADNEFLLTVPEPRKETETRPVFTRTLANLHVHERGSVVFPRETTSDDLLGDRDANIAEPAWRALSAVWGLSGKRREQSARDLVGRLFRLAFCILHAPGYQAEHKSALASDWAHLPIPRDPSLLAEAVALGEDVVRLLDTGREALDVVRRTIGDEAARNLGALTRRDGTQLRADDLRIAITYWGGGKGRWVERDRTASEAVDEQLEAALGISTGDLWINDGAFFANVPAPVWSYQLGGYPVLKKWLGYRQADRRAGQSLSDSERRWFRAMVSRIAALLALAPRLDEIYQRCAADAFTSTELGIRG